MAAADRKGTTRRGSRGRLVLAGAVLLLLAVGVGSVALRGGADVADQLPGQDPAVAAAPDSATAPGGAVGDGAAEPGDGVDGDVQDTPASTVAAVSPEGADTTDTTDTTAPATAGVDWAAPSEPSPVEPIPAERRVPKPAAVRGIYVGAWTIGNARRRAELIELANETEINAFVIDIKDVSGELSYASRVPLAEQVGATREIKIADLPGLLAELRQHGIYPIARIVVFKDPLLANARPDWAIEREDGSIWEDNNGVHWVDSFNRAVWDYNIELAREAVALGFSEIQWDYVRFPDVPSSYAVEAVYPARDGRAKTDAIREFMLYARDSLEETGAPLTADVFGITTSTRRDIGIGQVWEKMSDAVDVLLPMVYPSHYPDGSWHFPNPNAAPYQIVKKAMDDGVERSKFITNAATIRPWLQAFSMGEPEYGPRHLRAQIDAVYDAGLTEWVFWSPGVRYPREAFADADGTEPWFAGLGESLYDPEPGEEPAPDEPLGEPIGTP